MPQYWYKARSFGGEIKSGVCEAKDEKDLAAILRKEGFLLVLVEEKERKKRLLPSFFRKISLKEKIFFTRNLQMMISAGTSLPRALKILSEETKNKKFKNLLSKITEEIIRGKTFSEALAPYPDVFPEIFQSMIKVGEETGTLEESLGKITEQIERDYELKSRIKGALIYPTIVILATLGVGVLMITFIVPKMAEVFKELEIPLPFATRTIIGLANFLNKNWIFLVLFLIFIALIFRFLLRTAFLKRNLDRFLLKVPAFSSFIKQMNTVYTLRSLSSLLSSGVSMLRSLEIVSQTLGNVSFQKAILETSERVKKGEKLSEALKRFNNLYPSVIFEMIAVGEETGQTAEILSKLADFFDQELSNTTKNFASAIEPIVILLIGITVGLFAISVIQPIYSVLGGLQSLK